MKGNLIITLHRLYGSGGKEIGAKLAKLLGIKLYDEEIPQLASEKSGIRKDYFEKVDEKPTDSFLYALAMNTFSSVNSMNPLDHTLSSDRLFNIQAEVIRNLAKQESFVLIGRCGEYILRDEPNVARLYLCAPMDKRVERVCRLYNLSEKEAIKTIRSTDKKRESYYGYYAGKDWGACSSYDLSVDTSVLGIDKTVTFIKNYLDLKNGQ